MITDHIAKRVKNLPPYLFVGISKKIQEKRARGEEVISFGIGDPDIPTPQHIIDSLQEASRVPVNHRYPETYGLPELRRAIAEWYQKRFEVKLDPETEILPLLGSKEGIAHIALCFIDPGDIALVPDPCYPVYPIGTMLAGGDSYYMPLTAENGFLPEYKQIPADILQKAKLLWINYPNNPTGAVCDLTFFEKTVDFARQHDIAVCHDGPYTEVAYDGYRPFSFLQAKGAKDVGVEFHSCSKTYNMTGWRIGWVAGNATMVDALMRIKSNLDSGIPQAIQKMAITALGSSQDCILEHNEIYEKRRDRIIQALHKIGVKAEKPRASLYIWAKVPQGYTSLSFTDSLLDEVGVVVTPGTGYGNHGEGYIRLSLTISETDLNKGLAKLTAWQGKKTNLT